MEFKAPRIVRKLAMEEYAEELRAWDVEVWVNPPMARFNELMEWSRRAEEVKKKINHRGTEDTEEEKKNIEEKGRAAALELEEIGKKIMGWASEMWSQGVEGTRWTVEEVERFVADSEETDPALWRWMMDRTVRMIIEHRAGVKKN